MQIVKVSSWTNPVRLAGAIAGIVRSGEQPVLQGTGVEAIDKAVRAIIRANDFSGPEGLELAYVPTPVQMGLAGS